MSYKNIVFEHLEDGIATLTVSRPEKLNAIDQATMGELETAFAYAQNEPTVRGLILTGAGEKSFVAGADIHELQDMRAVEAARLSDLGQSVFRRLESMRKPRSPPSMDSPWGRDWSWRWPARFGWPFDGKVGIA